MKIREPMPMLQYATILGSGMPAFATAAPMSPAILDAQWRALPLHRRAGGWLRFHWERYDMGGKLVLAGCALGGGALGLLLAHLDGFDADNLFGVMIVIFMGAMAFAISDLTDEDGSSRAPLASNAMILTAMRRTLRLFGEGALAEFHTSISNSVRKSHFPLDRSTLIFAYRRIARNHAPKRLKRIARRAETLRQQKALLLANIKLETPRKGPGRVIQRLTA